MSGPTAFSVPCRTCGAPLPVDLESGRVVCAYCKIDQPLDPALRDRLFRHERAVWGANLGAEMSRDMADDARRDEREEWRKLIKGAIWLFALGAFVLPCVLVPLVIAREADWPWLLVEAPVLLALGLSILGLTKVASWTQAKREPIVTGAELGIAARCADCGATVPIKAGVMMPCPFCGATLVPDPEAQRDIERAAKATRDHEQGAARRAFARSFVPMYVMFGLMIAATLVYAALYEPPGPDRHGRPSRSSRHRR